MDKIRLTAFSDGIIAILITIMVLGLQAPNGSNWSDLASSIPTFLSYLLSFVYIAIYWNNHHHLLYTIQNVNGLILWTNTHLLFWISLIPFATSWLGKNHFAPIPTAFYGITLLMPAIAYFLLVRVIILTQGKDSILEKAIGRDIKGKISPLLYLLAIGLAFFYPWISDAIYVLVACIWLIPDRRIEKLCMEKFSDE